MKALFCILLTHSCMAIAYNQTYCYKTSDELKISVDAETPGEGFRKAGKLCYKILTKDQYPGEEKGLEIIDICANGKRCK